MAVSVFLKAVTRRAQLPSSLSSYQFNTQFTSLGSRAYCSKADHTDPVAQAIKPIIIKVLEIPSGHTFFEFREGDDVGWCYLSDFLHSYLCKVHDNIEKTKASFPNGKNSRCGLKLDLNDIFKIRIWEIITGGDKHVLDIIVSELKRNGFDLTQDPVTLQKIEEAVERAMTRVTNGIKLNLPVPAGEPDVSATISWGKYAGPLILKIISVAPSKIIIGLPP
ncbi:hypothetical protein MKX01_000821 [Papaver californicum]|nr:hypothetical protein MKX01_000821 [Papaver californicum]